MAYAVPASYTTYLATSPTVAYTTTASVLSNGQPVSGFTSLPVESLAVTASRSSAQRFSVTAVLTWTATTCPVDLTSVLSPGGNEMTFSIGVHGTVVPLGIFPIVSVELADSGTDVTMTVTLADRSWSISRRALTDVYNLPGTLTITQAISTLVGLGTATMPPFSESISPTSSVVAGNSYQGGQDPWQAATDVATAYGWELFFDRYGNMSAYTVPNPANQAVAWTYTETFGHGLGITSATRTLTADQITNDVIVSGTNAAGAAIQAEASDNTNQASPTYTLGPFGDIPSFVTTSVATDLPSMQAEAISALTTSLGQSDTIQLECLPNPAIDIDDIINVTRSRIGVVNQNYVVDGYTLNRQVGGTMTLDLRKVVA